MSSEKLIRRITAMLEDENKYQHEVISILIDSGFDEETATNLVEKIAEQIEEDNYKNAWESIITGIIFTIVGLILTLILFAQGWIVTLSLALIIAGISKIITGINNRYKIY